MTWLPGYRRADVSPGRACATWNMIRFRSLNAVTYPRSIKLASILAHPPTEHDVFPFSKSNPRPLYRAFCVAPVALDSNGELCTSNQVICLGMPYEGRPS